MKENYDESLIWARDVQLLLDRVEDMSLSGPEISENDMMWWTL